MSDVRLTPETIAAIDASYQRAFASLRPAALRGEVLADGRVAVDVTGDNGAAVKATLNRDGVASWLDTLQGLASESRRRAQESRGEHLWVVTPMAGLAGVYLVQHGGRARHFVGTQIRRRRRCSACQEQVEPHETMWRQRTPEPGANPSWREVRLCESCVTRTKAEDKSDG